MLLSIANVTLYICLSIVTGFFLLRNISEARRPAIHIPLQLIKWLIIMIPILLLVPVVRVTWTIYSGFSVPLLQSIRTVFLEYSVGQAFLVAVIIVIGLLVCLSSNKNWINSVALAEVFLLIVMSSWSSHGTSVAGWFGFLGNSLHLLAVSVWVGTLSVVGWFSREWNDPNRFFQWFSVTAGAAVIIIIVSGFMLMASIVPEYVQAWLLNYGQLLFIKHLMFLPLLAFGFHHLLLGFQKVKPAKNDRVKRSFRVESIIAFIIFSISAVMTEQTPPHVVAQTLQTEKISWLMQFFIGNQLGIGRIDFTISIFTVCMGVIAIILFIIAMRALIRSHQHLKSTLFFLFSVVVLYLGAMLSVEIGLDERDETVFTTIEKAISQTYDSTVDIKILTTEYQEEEEVYVVYTVDSTDLVAEKLIQVEGGYMRLPTAMLTIGGTSVIDERQKIRTFRVKSGNWHKEDFEYTYVTFGMISEPVDVARVQIHYEGGSYIAQLEKDTFINVVSSNEKWADQHPIDFLAEDGQLIETYARNVMEEGVYCH
ncbi:copper resistance D family protein [Alkalihalobacillus deserti]|uniref:copper resistance D family protein n=1 Tax=Alkalihalobacillus deserti TaxID=2879466 RepID=UPI001D14781C|nr:CopD family protein [Alkalihalobacillus deserti]